MKKFMVIWTSQAISLFGSAVVEFALAWYLTIKTGSATILATSMLVAILPQVVLGPFIGPYIDRWDRKRIMIVADIAISTLTIGLAVLFWLDAIQIWHIYIAMAGRAVGQAFHFPASMAAVTMIVPKKDLTRAAGLNQMIQGVITIAGPPAGAFLFGILPIQGVLMVDIMTAVIAVLCLIPIVIPHPKQATDKPSTSIIFEMIEGFRYIWKWKGLTWLIGLSAIISVFIAPAIALLPIMVNQALAGDVLKLGWIEAAFGVGIILGGLLLGVWPGFKNRIITCLTGVILCGLAATTMGLTSQGWFQVGLASSFIVGFGMSFANGPIMAVLQATIEKNMQGRIFSLMGSVSSAMVPIGLIIAGSTSDAIGIGPLFYICGIAVMMTGIILFFVPALMNFENQMKPHLTELVQGE
ncbi:MFS transporter [Dehalogenimonas etheniformans]|uniref:MFS transporter n=1 Tax=Dehalogenimonas etheniformans TaxID=1536648 RepID=A0A2P5P6Z4_9CHLR|nr:MFS transporter [Dehalogenimonas etheniformans]PPD58060.1 MFS transporter [Dehalogenimonas etheniformans]QNT75410.1 MFS transporter [Dehalogenimonas etheniformans]